MGTGEIVKPGGIGVVDPEASAKDVDDLLEGMRNSLGTELLPFVADVP